jgi:energy-coupling factor transporter ATP-binding protein EcfA2
MRLLGLELRSFRCFAGQLSLSLQPQGLTLLAGDNEEGKSSVLAALETVLFERHNISGTALEAIRPWGGGDPAIAARFRLDGREWRIEKRFGRGAQARLFEGSRCLATDAEAERRLVDLLRFEPRQGRSEVRPEHRGLLGLFWLQQGTSFQSLEVPDGVRGALAGAVVAEVDVAVGGARVQSVLARARERAANLLTASRRQETGELRALAAELEAVNKRLEELERQWRRAETELAELERLREEARRIARRDELGEARRRLAELTARKAEIDRLAIEVERAHAVQVQRRNAFQQLAERRRYRQKLQAELDTLNRDRVLCGERLTERARRREREAAELEMLRERQQQLDAALRAREAQLERLRQASERERLRAELDRAQADRQRIASLVRELAELSQRLAAVRLTPEMVTKLRHAVQEEAAARAALEAVATRLEFRPSRGQRVWREDRELVGPGPLLLTEPATFTLEGFGTLRVRPGAQDLPERQRRLAFAHERVRELTQAAGVADLIEAEALLRLQAEWLAARERLSSERRLLLERYDCSSEAELDARIAEQAGRLQAIAEATAGVAPETAEVLLRLAEEQRQQREEAAAVASEIGRRARAVQELDVELARLQSESQQLEGRIQALQQETAALRAELADEDLDRSLAAAQQALERAETEYVTLKRELDRQDPGRLEEEIDRQGRRIVALEADDRRRRERIMALEAGLHALGASDLAEQLQGARGERERLARAYAAKRREALAWWLLVERLETVQRRRREALTRPVVERTLPWLRRLFPDAELELDPDRLAITRLARGGVREPFSSLSVGTREQLAVLVRLALAGLLGEARGEPPCLILDDALAYADEHRFEVMKGILECAARDCGMQILILTCRPRDWLGIDAALIRLQDCAAPLSP